FMAWNPKAGRRDRAIVAPIFRDRGPKESDQGKISLWLGSLSVAVLLIACVNCATLLLLRASRRRRDFAIRTALGASKVALVRLLLLEHGLMTLAGAAAAAVVAILATTMLRDLLLPADTSSSAVSSL